MSELSMNDTREVVRRQATIGLFALGGVALALAVIVLFGKTHLFSPTMRAAIVFQDSVSGLTVGAPVNFRGVRIGTVARITVEFDTGTQTAFIPVIVELEPKRVVLTGDAGRDAPSLSKAIDEGLRAQLNTQSFVTGQSDLDFDPASASVLHPTITALPEIPTRQSTIQRVKDELDRLPLRELAGNANATVQNLRSLTDKLDRSLPALIDSLQSTSDQTATAIAQASQAVLAVQQRADKTLDDLGRLVDAGTAMLAARGGEVHTVLVTSNQTVAQARDILRDLKGLTSERGADRTNIDAALRDLAAATAALRGLASDVERNPQLLLTGRRP